MMQVRETSRVPATTPNNTVCRVMQKNKCNSHEQKHGGRQSIEQQREEGDRDSVIDATKQVKSKKLYKPSKREVCGKCGEI